MRTRHDYDLRVAQNAFVKRWLYKDVTHFVQIKLRWTRRENIVTAECSRQPFTKDKAFQYS